MEYFQYFGLFPFFVLLKLGEAYYCICSFFALPKKRTKKTLG